MLLLPLPALAMLSCDAPKKPIAEPTTSSHSTSIDKESWPSTTVDAVALAALDADSRAAVARSPVPVLVPRRKELLAVSKVMVEEHWYAFAATSGGVTVSIHATNVVHQYDDIAPIKGKHTVRGLEGWVTQNEAIWSASWKENNVAYTLDVECAEPTESRCKSDTFVLALASDLVYVGGRGPSKSPTSGGAQ